MANETTPNPRKAPLLALTDAEYVAVHMFIVSEAELLDTWDLAAWLELLAPEVSITMPVQTTRWRQDPASKSNGSFHYEDNRITIEMRVKRLLESNTVWSENPLSRTRRFVSNLRVRRAADGGLHAWTNLLLNRSRGDREAYETISAERHDQFIRSDVGALQLTAREITIDQTRLPMGNLPFPI
jgi:3-phenylpropionate/cinnamic acid dioxygenase small subunit